jgi:hypothetical protein
MFFDWVTKGAEIGTIAFVALVVFALYLAAVYGMLSLGTRALKEDEDEKPKRRAY